MEIILLTVFYLVLFLVLILVYFNHAYSYWSTKGVPIITPKFPLGNSNSFFPRGISIGTLSKKFYDELKVKKAKFGGVYLVTEPNLVLLNPEYIKDVLCKEFHHFVDRGFYYNKKHDPLSAHLFAIDGNDWRNLRVKLTPTFTSGKMKMMFRMMENCSSYMKDAWTNSLDRNIDVKDMVSRFTIDVIGSCAFGIECNSFKHPEAEFRQMATKIFEYSPLRSLNAFVLMNLPKLALKLGLTHSRHDVEKFFMKIVTDAVKMREEKNYRREDFLQLLIDLKQSEDFTLEEIAAQVFLFFIAGFDTSSTAMTFALYEIAKNPKVQERLRQEVDNIRTITYESLQEMKYLQQVLDETLRMYPPVTTLNRRCTKKYTLRDTNVVIEEGTPLLISTLGLHMDPEYFPEPEKFDPERFNDENRSKIVPFTYLPFGDGPRNCIGLRFGRLQAKLGIATIVKNFSLSVSPLSNKVEFNPYVFLLSPLEKVYLKAKKL